MTTWTGTATDWLSSQVIGRSEYQRVILTDRAVPYGPESPEEADLMRIATLREFWPGVEFLQQVRRCPICCNPSETAVGPQGGCCDDCERSLNQLADAANVAAGLFETIQGD